MKKFYLTTFIILALVLLLSPFIKAQKITVVQPGKSSSLRGVSIVNDKIAWVSGSRGTVAITKDAGKTWLWQQVKGFEQSDFRDVQAFSG